MKIYTYVVLSILAVMIGYSVAVNAEGGKEREGVSYPSDDDITYGNQLCLKQGLKTESITISCDSEGDCSLVVVCEDPSV